MPAYFEQGFFVRVPAWHGLGVVLDDYPGREEAMRLAGHDFDIVEVPVALIGKPLGDEPGERVLTEPNGFRRSYKPVTGWKGHVRSDDGELLHVSKDSFERIPNAVAYDVAELLLGQGFRYETGITLKGGAVCALTLLLDEPITIPGDDSHTLPYCNLSWAHDGTGALKVRSGAVRQVCANTVSASEAEGKALGTAFTFRHTKNVNERIEEARETIKGVRHAMSVYEAAMADLAEITVSEEQRDLFIATILPLPISSAAVSERVVANCDADRAKLRGLFDGPTIPEAHKLTGYGLHLAGVEFFDHLRSYRSPETYVNRTLLQDDPKKARLAKTIREVVAA